MLTAISLIIVLFVGLLVVKALTGLRVCLICGAVFGTWLVLLLLYHGGYYANTTIIALLVGQSIVGGIYLLRSRLPDQFDVFLLPALLTATVGGYMLLRPELLVYSIEIVILAWIATSVLYAHRENERISAIVHEIKTCCRDW